jgi:hypothetical protein
MEAFVQAFSGWELADPVGFLLLVVCATLAFFFAMRARAGREYSLREIGGYEAIKAAVGRAAEEGKPLHMALGTGGIGGLETLQTAAGIKILEHLSRQAALCDTPLIASVGDPTALPAAQDIMYNAYEQSGYPDEYDGGQVRYQSNRPAAYAAGVMTTIGQEDLAANVMVGSFGDEFLLMSEAGSRKGIVQVGGATDKNVLPFAHASVDHTLIGEEIFAGGAYLDRDPNHVGGLMAQDVMRTAIVLTVVLGVVLKTLGVL